MGKIEEQREPLVCKQVAIMVSVFVRPCPGLISAVSLNSHCFIV